MSAEPAYALKILNTAFMRLKEAAEQAVDELDRDGVIQRFEFTFELLLKTTKVMLEYEGFHCAGPRSCIKEGARRELLVEGEILLDMLEDRNKTAPIYDEHTAREIFERIRGSYIRVIDRNMMLFGDYLARQ
jgi:nucleotidyltransferase substrate binding protein (TIGR01987 family)